MESRRWQSVIVGVAVLLWVSAAGLAVPVQAQGEWYAEYFPNRDLAGGPALTRYESSSSFDWGLGSPGAGIPSDGFSARLTRTEWFEAGTYRFSYRSDDGVRVWVGDSLVVDDWRERQAYWSSNDYFIPRGTHSVRIEYFEGTGSALIEVGWERVVGGRGYRGEYYDNRDLSGSPVLVREFPAGNVPLLRELRRWRARLR